MMIIFLQDHGLILPLQLGHGKEKTAGIVQGFIVIIMKLSWKTKAKIMKGCALLPAGAGIYRFIQKTFGRLKANPMSRIPAQTEIARWIFEMGGKVGGKTVFEVGTGHCLIVPIGFFVWS